MIIKIEFIKMPTTIIITSQYWRKLKSRNREHVRFREYAASREMKPGKEQMKPWTQILIPSTGQI